MARIYNPFLQDQFQISSRRETLARKAPHIFQAWNTRPVADTTLSMCQAVERMISIPYYMDRQSFLV
jgi:hypothetical protein